MVQSAWVLKRSDLLRFQLWFTKFQRVAWVCKATWFIGFATALLGLEITGGDK